MRKKRFPTRCCRSQQPIHCWKGDQKEPEALEADFHVLDGCFQSQSWIQWTKAGAECWKLNHLQKEDERAVKQLWNWPFLLFLCFYYLRTSPSIHSASASIFGANTIMLPWCRVQLPSVGLWNSFPIGIKWLVSLLTTHLQDLLTLSRDVEKKAAVKARGPWIIGCDSRKTAKLAPDAQSASSDRRSTRADVAALAAKMFLLAYDAPVLNMLKPTAVLADLWCQRSQVLDEIARFLDSSEKAAERRGARLKLWLSATREQDRIRDLSERLRDAVSVLGLLRPHTEGTEPARSRVNVCKETVSSGYPSVSRPTSRIRTTQIVNLRTIPPPTITIHHTRSFLDHDELKAEPR
ncbi:hypothetical protein DFH09DRAFT_1104946 [Mycena vulgaris]|nr:hypothetical protein DFH09DRAFT_1104946 [Mycena vulgaris]